MAFVGTGTSITALNATNLGSGTVPLARLGSSGTPSTTTFLRGDNTWATPAGGGGAGTGLGDVGSYAILMNVTTTSVAQGGTVAGSSLRHSWTQNPVGPTGGVPSRQNDAHLQTEFGRFWNQSLYGTPQGGTAMSGTWRKMSATPTYMSISYLSASGYNESSNCNIPALYVRIS